MTMRRSEWRQAIRRAEAVVIEAAVIVGGAPVFVSVTKRQARLIVEVCYSGGAVQTLEAQWMGKTLRLLQTDPA